ncbi:MAG: hypothetical protein IKO34_11155 [Bacteroidales bacterium]|nr:hypothetical protein [Bacteroidales bacterium]
MKNGLHILAAIFMGAFLAACGESGDTVENVTQITQGGVEVISDVGDLPKCKKDNEGEQVLVKGESTVRICVDGKWFASKESTKDTLVVTGEFSCTTKELPDSSGLKIICNGDSVGVVKNGAAGKDGEDGLAAADGCEITQDSATVTVICNGEMMRFNMDAEGIVSVDTTALDSEKIAVSLDEVTGVSQKGPFLSGSEVVVRELRDGRSLAQTGNAFNGKILNDRGEFKINARTLMSQYVTLEVNGFYRNEVTGGNSDSKLPLFAITNVLKSSNVNINLLTHLEYERVNYLVTKKKYSVTKAKATAQREVFGLFGIDATGFSSSEYLNIAGASDEDGALLAFSVLLQGDRSVSQLSELLTKIAADMEQDGTWDDAKTRMAIAEWASDADSSGKLDSVRNNVNGWNLSSAVPNFEQFVRNFWYKEYGLDSCKAKNKDMVKAATAGKRKGTKTRYICKEDGAGLLRWQIASDFEKDTYGWKDTTDGALKNGAVTDAKYVFDKTGSYNGTKGWRSAVAVENVHGGCTESLYGSIRSYYVESEAGYYLCQKKTHKWELTNDSLMIDTQGWADADDGASKWGDSIGVVPVTAGDRICYVYDTSVVYRGWRAGNDEDCTLDLGGCTKGHAGKMERASNSFYYDCDGNNTWTMVSDEVRINTQGWNCLDSNEGEFRKGIKKDAYFVCEKSNWREASTDEELVCRNDGLCSACTENRQGVFETSNETEYVCDAKLWRKANCAEKLTKSLCTANDSALVENCETVNVHDMDYVCSGGKWHAVTSPFEYTLKDWNRKKEKYYTSLVHPDAVYGEDFTDPRDGNTYKTVVFNGKRVFAENLRYVDSRRSLNLKGNVWCYNNEAKNCEIGGAYYTWTAAVDLDCKWKNANASSLIGEQHQGICPDGWHVPNDEEWKDFFNNVGSKKIGYNAMLMVGAVSWVAANNAAAGYATNPIVSTNASGFSALPVGARSQGNFKEVGSGAYFWSSTDSSTANYWYLAESYAGLNKGKISFLGKYYGLVVRCFQDILVE